MNSLTWFLYLADVLVSLRVLFMIGSLVGTIAFAILIIGAMCYAADNRKPFQWKIFWVTPLWIFILLGAVIIPSQKTMYLMMGSEVTEMAATSEVGQEVLTTTKEIILQKLKEFKESQ